MGSSVRFRRTAAGDAALQDRSVKLTAKLRALLHFVDGRRARLELGEVAAKLGAPEGAVEQLYSQGLIETTIGEAANGSALAWQSELADPVKRVRTVHQFMNDTIVDALGIRAFFFVLKLERCASIADYQALADAHREAIRKASTDAHAAVINRQLLALMDGCPAATGRGS
jgi:hypothetical protein